MAVSPLELAGMQEYMRRLEEEEKRRKQGDQLRLEGTELNQPVETGLMGVMKSTDRLFDPDLTPEQRFSKRSVLEEPSLLQRTMTKAADAVEPFLDKHPGVVKELDEWFKPDALPADAPFEDVVKQAIQTPILPPSVTKGIGGGIYDVLSGDWMTPEPVKQYREAHPDTLSKIGKGIRGFSEEAVGGLLTPQALGTLASMGTSAGPAVVGAQIPGMVTGTAESGKKFIEQAKAGNVPEATKEGLNTVAGGIMSLLSGEYVAKGKPVVRPRPTEESFYDSPEVIPPDNPQLGAGPAQPQQIALPPQAPQLALPPPAEPMAPPRPTPKVSPEPVILGGGLGNLQELFEKSPHEKILDQAEVTAKKTGQKVADVISPEDGPINSDLYADAMTRQKDVARKAGAKGVGEKIVDFYKSAKEKIVDGLSPIEDAINFSAKKQSFTVLPRYRFTEQVERVLQSDAVAKAFARDHGLFDVIRAPKNATEMGRFDQYLEAQHNLDITVARGGKSPTERNLARDEQMLADFDQQYPQFKEWSDKLRGYSHKLLDYSVESGLISQHQADLWKKQYPNYVPLNRIFGEEEVAQPKGGGRGPASISQSVMGKELKGSAREVESPLVNFLARTGQVIREGEINKTAHTLVDTMNWPDNPLKLKPLRTAENIEKRIGLYSELKELKPLRKAAHDLLVSNRAEVRQLQAELNNLEKQGLESALGKESKEGPADLVSSLQTIRSATEKSGIRPTRFETKFATTKNRGAQSTKAFIERLITDPNVDLAAIRRKIATRENKLGGLIDDIQNLKYGFDAIQNRRMEIFDEAKLARDAASRGKATISRLVNGHKEIYETEPWVTEAAKNINSVQLGIVERMLNYAMRLPRMGTTGLNIPFAGSNLLKDIQTAFIQGRNWKESLSVNPLTAPITAVRSFIDAIGHGKIMQELDRQGASGSLLDFGKDRLPDTIQDIRMHHGLNLIQVPFRRPVGTAEHIIGSTEKMTRVSAYKGAYDYWRKQGMNETDAKVMGAKAARENTANFFRKGTWGKTLNSVIMFLNARIQGTRSLMRAYRERPLGTFAKTAILLYLPQIVTTLWNLSDPKRAEIYKRIDEREKENSMPVVLPGSEYDPGHRTVNQLLKIPLAPDHQGELTLIRHLIEHYYGAAPQSVVQDAFNAVTGLVSPVPLTKSGAVSGLTPQLPKPFLEDYTNKDFFTQKPIVPPHMQEWLPQEQVYPWTSGTARQLGGLLDMSPLRVEHFIRSSSGGLGLEALNMADRLQNLVRPEGKEIPVGGQSLLEGFKRRFTQASATQDLPEDASRSNRMQQYDLLDKLEQRGAYRGIEAEANKAIQKAMDDPQYRKELGDELERTKANPPSKDDPDYKLLKVIARRFEQTFGSGSDKTFRKMSSDAQVDYLFHEEILPAFKNAQTAQQREEIINQIVDQHGASERVRNGLLEMEEEWTANHFQPWLAPIEDRLKEFETHKLP